MISYYCTFGDTNVGYFFKKIIFGNIKVISFFDNSLKSKEFENFKNKILIRYFLDGDVTEYNQISDSSFFYDNRNKVVVFNYRLKREDLQNLNLTTTFDFIKATTLKSLLVANEKLKSPKVPLNYFDSLSKIVEPLFSIIYKQNVLNL